MIKLPKDAKGRGIPLDTQMLYSRNGIEFFIDKVIYEREIDKWYFFGHFGPNTAQHQVAASKLCLTLPDSWKKLLEDLDRAANAKGFGCCAYADRSERDCSSCIAANDRACTQPIMRDIAFRIRKLVGEDE